MDNAEPSLAVGKGVEGMTDYCLVTARKAAEILIPLMGERAAKQASVVAPVVRMSSTRRMCLFSNCWG